MYEVTRSSSYHFPRAFPPSPSLGLLPMRATTSPVNLLAIEVVPKSVCCQGLGVTMLVAGAVASHCIHGGRGSCYSYTCVVSLGPLAHPVIEQLECRFDLRQLIMMNI